MEIHILIQIRVWMQIRRFVTAAASHLLRRPDMSYHRSAFWRQSTQIFLNNQEFFFNNQENIFNKLHKYFSTIKKIFLQNQESIFTNTNANSSSMTRCLCRPLVWLHGGVHQCTPEREKQCKEHFLCTEHCSQHSSTGALLRLRLWYWERRAWALRSQGWWVVGAAVIMDMGNTYQLAIGQPHRGQLAIGQHVNRSVGQTMERSQLETCKH